MKRILPLVSCAVLLASCGGGGAGAPDQPATTLRSNQIGDSWNYSVSISFGQFGAYKGTLSEGLTADTYNGQPSIRDTQTFNLALNTGPSTITSYSEISPQGALLAEMVNAVLYGVTSDTFSVGGTIDASTSASGVITLSNGETISETFKVIGEDVVNTVAGSFACWIVSQKVVNSNGTSDTFVMWMAPEIGNYARITDTTLNPDGTGYTYTASLTSIVTVAGTTAPRGSAARPSLIQSLGHCLKLGSG